MDRCLLNLSSFQKPCGAGVDHFGIAPNGDIYPCHQFYFIDEDTKIGNIFTEIDEQKLLIFKNYDHTDLSCPTDCDHFNCYRCIASNYQYNGSIFIQTRKNYCKLMKIDQFWQKKLAEEMKNMGVFNTEEIPSIACSCK
jgi:uncharacterized protein